MPYSKGARVLKREDLKVGEVYCLVYNGFESQPCIFAKFLKKYEILGTKSVLFKRLDPSTDPYDPEDIGGDWSMLKVYNSYTDEDPTNGGKRKRKTRRHTRKQTTRKRRTQ